MLAFFTSEDVSPQLDARPFMRSFLPSLIPVHGVAQSTLPQRTGPSEWASMAVEKGLCLDFHPVEEGDSRHNF